MKSEKNGRVFVLYCVLCVAVALALLLYPLYVIRPFRAQGPNELQAALAVLRYRPVGMVVCVIAALAATAWYWAREPRKMRRFFSAIGVAIVAGIALLSRINIYEMMFHPFERPTFASAAQAKLDGREMVIAVTGTKSARAYPIRSLSYHHLLNDTLDGVPIVPTY